MGNSETYFPVRGRKPTRFISSDRVSEYFSETYFPVRGRKPMPRSRASCMRFSETYFPVRGRKLSSLVHWANFLMFALLWNLFPRKGTETSHLRYSQHTQVFLLWNLFPRKGTETRWYIWDKNGALLWNLFPRKGTETRFGSSERSANRSASETYFPVRGRKHCALT